MMEAYEIDQWNHTAAQLAMAVNTAFGKKSKASVAPKDFHPFAEKQPRPRRSREEMIRSLNQMVGLKEHGRQRKGTSSRPSSH